MTHGDEFDSPQFWKAKFFTLGLARPASVGHEGRLRNEVGTRSQIQTYLLGSNEPIQNKNAHFLFYYKHYTKSYTT